MKTFLLGAVTLCAFACRDASADSQRPSDPSRESCIDRYLADRGLNPYGDPPGRMYPGGTPLFDERTGALEDRLEHVMKKHPDARRLCGGAPGSTRDR